jgi:hypothetical protein
MTFTESNTFEQTSIAAACDSQQLRFSVPLHEAVEKNHTRVTIDAYTEFTIKGVLLGESYIRSVGITHARNYDHIEKDKRLL